MFVPFNKYVKDVYDNASDSIKQKYDNNPAKHKAAYISRQGFGHWLSEMRGDTLTPSEVKILVQTYVQYGKRQASDIPGILENIQNMMQVNVLVEDGMDTAEYWAKQLDSTSEMAI